MNSNRGCDCFSACRFQGNKWQLATTTTTPYQTKCWHGFPARKLALVVIVVLSALTLKELPLRVAQQQSVRSAQLKRAIMAAKRLQKFFALCANRKLEVDATNVAPALFSLVFKV
jgi:hypothetical protein